MPAGERHDGDLDDDVIILMVSEGYWRNLSFIQGEREVRA